MKKIAWLLVAALLFSVLPVSTGMGEVQAVDEVDNILPSNTAITSEHIPDTSLLAVIKDKLGKSSQSTVTYEELQTITELEYDVAKTADLGLKPIESLVGIKYLVELDTLNINGQNVTDLTPVGDCGNLRALWADDNKITTMPSWSSRSMRVCQLDRNQLSEEVLRKNFPNCLGTVDTTCKKQILEPGKVTVASKYYEVKGKNGNSYYPFVVVVEGLRQVRTYTVNSITVDETDYMDEFTVEEKNNHVYPFDKVVTFSANAGAFLSTATSHHLKIVVKDEYEESIVIEEDFVLEPMQNNTVIEVKEPEYFSCSGVRQTGILLRYKELMTQASGVTVTKVELKNQEGTVYATSQNVYSRPSYNYNDERYTEADVRNKCYDVIANIVGNGNICSVAMEETKLSISTWEDIEPGFYDVVYTLSDATTYTYKNAYEAVTRPIVYGVMDASQAYENNSIMTDQTGDYVSVYVYGWNIDNTITPVFYRGRQEISSNVEAVETGTWGTFFRIKKIKDIEEGTDFGGFYSLDRLPSTDTEGGVWTIPLSTNKSEATDRVGYKTYDVVIETEEEVFEEKAQIVRREIFSQAYDQRDKSYTVYFAQEADVDTTYAPTLTFETWSVDDQSYKAFVTVENGTIEETTNPLTEQKEIKAKFILNDDQIQSIKDNTTSYDLRYGVAYKTKGEDGEEVKFLSNYSYRETEAEVYVDDVPTRGKLDRHYDTVFYLPYWIGGVHTIAADTEHSYYLTDADVQTLGTGKYACGTGEGISKEKSRFSDRGWTYYFWEKGEPLTPPAGTPNLTVAKDGEKWKFSWDSIEGATSYAICIKYGEREETYRNVRDTYFTERAEVLPFLFQEFFEECRDNPDETKMQIFVRPMIETADDFAVGNASNVFVVAEIDSCKGINPDNHKGATEIRNAKKSDCGNAGYTGDTWCKDCNTKIASGKAVPATGKHTTKTVITKVDANKKTNGYNQTVCSVCRKVLKTNATYYYPKTVTVSDVTYNGKSQIPKVVVKDSKGKTISATNYAVSAVKVVGANKVTITFKGSYYTGKLTVTCKVLPVKTAISSISTGTTKPTVKWSKKTTYVTGYQIQYATNKNFTGAKTVTVAGSKYTSKAISLSKGKTYYVRICTYYTKSKVNYCSAWSVAKSTIIPDVTAVKSVTAGSKKLTVKWTKKTANVTGYQVQYSTSKSFKSAKTVTVKKNSTTSTTISKLSAKKKYYVRIRTYKTSGGKNYYSAWSAAKYQTTKK